MPLRLGRYLPFGVASLLAYVLIGFGSHALARMRYHDEDFLQTLPEVFGHLQPLWQAIEITPFLLLGAVSASLAHQSFARSIILFLLGLLAFATIYYLGYMDAEAYMAKRAWTAASLSAGFIPFKCVGVLLVVLVARILMSRRDVPAKANIVR